MSSMGNETTPVTPLTDEQVDYLLSQAVVEGLERYKSQGAAFRESDYLAGILVALNLLGRWDRAPAHWIFEIMRGSSVLDPSGELEKKYEGSKAVWSLDRDDVRNVLHADHALRPRLKSAAFMDALYSELADVLGPYTLTSTVFDTARELSSEWAEDDE